MTKVKLDTETVKDKANPELAFVICWDCWPVSIRLGRNVFDGNRFCGICCQPAARVIKLKEMPFRLLCKLMAK